MNLEPGDVSIKGHKITMNKGHFNVTRGWANWVVYKDLSYTLVTGARDELDKDVLRFIEWLIKDEKEKE